MSVIFSKQCEYGIQAVLYLALKPHGRMTSIKELTKQLDIPYHFVAKILQDLTHKGLLKSLKGRSGGFGLSIAPEKITLFQIVEAIDGTGFMNNCVLGFPECSSKHPCAMHERWSDIRTSTHDALTEKDIATMAKGTHKSQYTSPKSMN